MKTICLAAVAAVTTMSCAFAGETTYHHDHKSAAQPMDPCFGEKEWQVDLFGAYAFSSSSQDNLFGDHAWGGGLGVNYFFTRNVGVGIEGSLFDPRSSGDVLGQAALNVFVRFPIADSCVAPYLFLGGGAVFNAEDVDAADLKGNSDDGLLEGHIGVGVEYRIKHNFGLFVDGRFTVVDKNDNNYTTIRTGFRIAF